MKITKAGDLGGTGVKIRVSLVPTHEQRRLGSMAPGELIELDVAPATARAQAVARKMYPDAIPPMREGRSLSDTVQIAAAASDEEKKTAAALIFDSENMAYRVEFGKQRRLQRIVLACFALGREYFGTDEIEDQLRILQGPANAGGLHEDQIEQIALESMAAAEMTPDQAEAVTTSVRPIVFVEG